MAVPTIATESLAYHRSSGFQAVYARPTSELYQTLGAIKEASLQLIDYKDADGTGKNKSWAGEFTASCKMRQTSLTELELLDTIAGGTCAFLFKMQDAAAIPSTVAVTEGWVLLSAAQIGAPKWTYDFSGKADNECFILLEWKGSLQKSEYAAAVKASIDDGDFESTTPGAGTLHGIGTYTATADGGKPTVANIKSAGVSAITLAETGGVAQTVGSVKNVKGVIACVDDDDEDSLARYLPHAVDINISYEMLQTDAANLINLGLTTDTEIDLVVTMKSGVIITLTNKVGIDTGYVAGPDIKKKKVIRFMHSGQVLKTDIDDVFST